MPANSAVRRFFRTPKGLLIIVLAILVALAAPSEGIGLVAPGLASAVIVAGLIDVLVLRWIRNAWEFPSGAVLTGLIVAMVLTPHEPWYVACLHLGSRHCQQVYCSDPLGERFQSSGAWPLSPRFTSSTRGRAGGAPCPRFRRSPWWCSSRPACSSPTGSTRFRWCSFSSAPTFCCLPSSAFLGDPGKVAEIFRAPDLHAVLFFAFFILTDPPTSPVKYPDQLVCGVIVAVVSYAIFEWVGAAYYLLAGVLVGNVWEAWHRWYTFSRRRLSPDADGHVAA